MVLDMLKPGVECSQIDRTVREYFKDKGVSSYTTHHQGHGVGLEFYEAPFLDTFSLATLPCWSPGWWSVLNQACMLKGWAVSAILTRSP